MRIFNFLLIINFIGFSQNPVGLIRYGEIQSMGMGAAIGADYNSILVFNKGSSLYITRQDSLEGGHKYKMNSYSYGENSFLQTYATNDVGFQYYYNRKKDSLYSRDLGFSYVKEKSPEITWSFTHEIKTIGNFECNQATTTFRGRNYIAWYTPDIPLPYGPWKLHGLPGIILEAYDSNKEIFWYFKSIEYPGNYTHLLKKITNNKNQWISFQDYKNFLLKTSSENTINSRIVSQSAGIEATQKNSMLNTYIEGFEIE